MTTNKKPQLKRSRRGSSKTACTVPGPVPIDALGSLVVSDDASEKDRIRAYVEWQASDEKVSHLERIMTEYIFGRPMDGWDVRTDKNRWWVITNPTNLYSQELFPSLDYTLSFHVGVTTRMEQLEMSRKQVGVHEDINDLLNRLSNARTTLFKANGVQDYQSVGVKCREALLLMVKKMAAPELVPKGVEVPQLGNVIAWCEIIANYVAAGSSHSAIRSHLKNISKSAWQLSNWLTHAQNADNIDASITCDATENVVEAFMITAARIAGAAERDAKRARARRKKQSVK